MEQTTEKQVVSVQLVTKVPPWARAFGVLGLVAAIAALIVPVIGSMLITIPAAILGMIALYGGDKKLGMTVFVIVAVNLVISPTFWINLFVGAGDPRAEANVRIALVDMLMVFGMIPFLFLKHR